MKRWIRVAAVCALPLTVVTACGGDDEVTAEDVKKKIVEQLTEGDEPTTAEQAECLADGVVAEFGVERANELAETAESEDIEDVLSASEIETFSNLAVGCIDMRQIAIDSMLQSGLSQDQAECVADALGDDDLQAMVSAGMSGGEADTSAVEAAALECMTS